MGVDDAANGPASLDFKIIGDGKKLWEFDTKSLITAAPGVLAGRVFVGDTDGKNCQNYPNQPCSYQPKSDIKIRLDYYPPGYFRVFGDFLAAHKPSSGDKASNGQSHKDFWYKTAETVWEMVERCYDQTGVHPGLIGNGGDILRPCSNIGTGELYEWGRALWRLGVDAARA